MQSPNSIEPWVKHSPSSSTNLPQRGKSFRQGP